MINARVIIPPLTDEEKSQGLNNFNDIAVSRGDKGLKTCLKSFIIKRQNQSQKTIKRNDTIN